MLPSIPSARLKRGRSLRIKKRRLITPFIYCKGTKKQSHIGRGCFGNIYIMQNKHDNQTYAMKQIKIKNFQIKMNILSSDTLSKSAAIDYILNESKQLALLNHPNIVRYYTTIKLKNTIYIALEYMKGGTLREMILKKHLSGKDKVIVNIISQICRGLCYLHAKNILHRDIKPDNILFESTNLDNPLVKLGDFGLSCSLEVHNVYYQKATSAGKGHRFYRSPEAASGQAYGCGDDYWAVGIVGLEMLSSCILPDNTTADIFAQYHEKDNYIQTIIEDHCSCPELKDIIHGLLNNAAQERQKTAEKVAYPVHIPALKN